MNLPPLAAVAIVLMVLLFAFASFRGSSVSKADKAEKDDKALAPIYCDGDTCPRCQEGVLSVHVKEISFDGSFSDTMQTTEVSCSQCGVISQQSLN